jgi:hypothetical protein
MRNVNIFVWKDPDKLERKIIRSIGPIPNDDRALVQLKVIESEYPTNTHKVVMRYAKEY